MTKSEVVNFMKKIKAYYDYFPMEDYKIGEWYDKLKKYDLDDVYMKLDQHLEGDLKDRPPQLHFIAKYLKTPEEKAKEKCNDFIIRCNLCGKEMKLSEYEQSHFDKCSSIIYLIRIFKEKKINIEYKDLEQLSQEKFNEIYKKHKKY